MTYEVIIKNLDLYDYFSKFSPKQLLFICVFLFVAVMALIGLSILTERYFDGTFNGIKFGTYEVKVKDNNKEQIVKVIAWNEVNAVEKIAKRIGKIDGVIFEVQKILKKGD